MYDTISLTLGVLGAISGVLLLESKRREWFSDRALRVLFGSSVRGSVVVVCPTQPRSPGSPNTATTYEDSLAQAEIQTRFSRRNIAHDAKLHDQIDDNDLQSTLVLICGPVGNSITRKFFESVSLPYHFLKVADTWTIADETGTPRHFPTRIPEEDLALLIAMRNPWARPDTGSCVYLVAGINGLGTWGAAVQLASRSNGLVARLNAENINPKMNGFAAVLRVSRDKHRPPVTKLLEIEAIAGHGIAA